MLRQSLLDARLARRHVRGMKHDPFDFSGSRASAANHGARVVPRLRPGEYTAEFLSDLRAGQIRRLFEAPAQWDGNRATLPPQIEWVLYANGELERIRFS